MTPEQFCYWLKGYSEVAGTEPNDYQWKVITDHLATVFHKVTPQYLPNPAPLVDLARKHIGHLSPIC